MQAELGNFYVISTFGTTNWLENAKIKQKIPCSATALCASAREFGHAHVYEPIRYFDVTMRLISHRQCTSEVKAWFYHH